MRKIFLLPLLAFCCMAAQAQRIEYKTFIYTSDNLSAEISKQSEESLTKDRSYLGDLFGSSKEAAKGIASGYVSSFIDMGVNAIGSLITRNAQLKREWEETVNRENVYKTQISTISEINDFYSEASFDGAMDPKGMRFDGIGCLRTDGQDTLFYVSCHIDRSKINRIINHSKFELVLDTLIISPTHSNLPNSPLNIPYSFSERQNFTFSLGIKLTSSWTNEIVQLQKNQELGEFKLDIPISPDMLDENDFFRYVRKGNEPSEYAIAGESFIVPRSFMGYRDGDGNYKNSWGTGEYKLAISLQENLQCHRRIHEELERKP